ncbi:hypothetical protein OJ253_1604 [Cryptosporidium canis]|uniref:Uncharacterized protein n=1 Tax=Cryptosporidium canis TaxID=195482 RepID=A0A9D5HXL9_9CRYT|nr:hypothetical protein OJ253_1604 [Cryptosporidium canis]
MDHFTTRDRLQLKFLEIPSLRGIQFHKNEAFISKTIWELISDLRISMEAINSTREHSFGEFMNMISSNEINGQFKKLQAKIIQEFRIGTPLLVPGVTSYNLGAEAVVSWNIYNFDTLWKMLWNIDGYCSMLKERVINPRNIYSIKPIMQKIVNKIQYIIVWNQVYLKLNQNDPSFYYLLLNHFIFIEEITKDIKSDIHAFVENYSNQNFEKHRFIIERIHVTIPYLPNIQYSPNFEINNLKIIFEELEYLISSIKRLRLQLENKYKPQLNRKEINFTNIGLIYFLIEVRYFFSGIIQICKHFKEIKY